MNKKILGLSVSACLICSLAAGPALALESDAGLAPSYQNEAAGSVSVEESAIAAAINKPFPQHISYLSGTIKPNHFTQAQLDQQVTKKYDEWKAKYLIKHPKISNQYYVYYNLEKIVEPEVVSCSEGHGYGMLITAYMAGYDSKAQTYYDGLYRFYKAHPSSINSALMAWQQKKDSSGNIVDSNDDNSATDGDMDIAYSLLLADKQWGSSGSINYKAEAVKMINAIMKSDVHAKNFHLKLGDWASDSDSEFGPGTRPSDFMLNHLKAYKAATGDSKWDKVTDTTYKIINAIFSKYSPKTGLLPDFVVRKSDGSYAPAPDGYLEEDTDDSYSWNSCRTPWRIATDYLVSGDTRALDQLRKMNSWIQSATGGNPTKIASGYELDGKVNDKAHAIAFTAPFAVSAMVDSSNQQWLNKLWTELVDSPTSDSYYFDNSIRLLSMIVVSGNWWTPDN
ncbi:glycosyl hydrolase family 8 [Paenibacillus sp. J22TS3]|uniref:glycosyl hydrolase family 8 n=1 Tax=Paenibacillus sp. J22TS3 TaxID=2807192 RepID=UPI001B25782B|nr:glycosyl hydrolase family 8 [Paenibacillus sp. J22TS3]GIP19812.1 licheninase [Paenibacillus sp. J22TS3]